MTENAVENPVCSACGAPVRPQALFCYNCGSSIAAAEAAAPEIEKTEQPRDEISDGNGAATQPLTGADENSAALPIGKPTETLVEDKPEKKSSSLPPAAAGQTETKLKSAAALRRGGRIPAQKKVVEVIWEEPENAPNVWFLVVAFVLALFAVGILLLMLYIR
ncbi:MAG: zinc ribbon domain-containing protein [Acidobacteriota bacterium]|nr:zinc ribbon domain-containing protein [Acidobacteriota bacterium]